jgi:hypothetical protein
MAIKPLPQETALLRTVLKSVDKVFRFSVHSIEEMKVDRISDADIRRVLQFGSVTWVERKRDLLWHVEGRDVDDRAIRVVVAVYQERLIIKIITAMVLK